MLYSLVLDFIFKRLKKRNSFKLQLQISWYKQAENLILKGSLFILQTIQQSEPAKKANTNCNVYDVLCRKLISQTLLGGDPSRHLKVTFWGHVSIINVSLKNNLMISFCYRLYA